ncbi:MAG: polysaccharide deacetylase family protein [Nitrospirota bacterium]|jgi:peptidoglycan/xylan/chitin deacetylase (PgdA/CDA1 family)
MTIAVPILMYHYLGDPPTVEDRPYYVARETFRDQLDLLHAEGFATVDLIDLAQHLEHGAALPAWPVILTFDDGHTSFHEVAADTLARTGYTATVFAITGRVGDPGYCDWHQLREVERAGHQVGSHTHTHPILTRLDDDATTDELTCSREILAAELGHSVEILAYRGGHHDERVVQLTRDAGYRCAVTTRPGINGPGADLLTLRRNAVRQDDTGERLLTKLRPEPRPSLARRLIRRLVPR